MKTRAFIVVVVLIFLAVTIYLKWGRRGDPELPSAALDAQSLRNAEYISESAESGVVQLHNGRLADEAAHLWVTMVNVIAYGDADGDGRTDAAVVLATNTGGSGVFHDLALVVDQGGEPVNVAIVNIGDRVKVRSISIDDRRIIVNMDKQGPSDPMCCPTMRVEQVYELRGEELALVEEIPIPGD